MSAFRCGICSDYAARGISPTITASGSILLFGRKKWMKGILSLLAVLGLILVAIGQVGSISVSTTLSGTFSHFETLGDENPLSDPAFKKSYKEIISSGFRLYNTVSLLGLAVLIISTIAYYKYERFQKLLLKNGDKTEMNKNQT